MKNKIVFIVGVLFAANVVYSEYQYCPVSNKDSGYIHNGPLMPRCTENDSPEIWSGSKADLDQIAKNADRMYGFENTKNLGRNATMLVPATRREMEWQIEQGEPWEDMFKISSVYHQESRIDLRKWNNTKYVNKKTGAEVVYNDSTGKIVMDEKMGTRNFGKLGLWSTMFGEHNKLDMTPHDEKLGFYDKMSRNGDQYKYVGILYEHDPLNPDVYYIVDGQTGRRMTKREVLEFPTTISNMWKDMGLACVKNDAIDIVPPKENRRSAQNASSKDGNDARKGDVAKTDADEAKDSNIHTPIDVSSLNFDDENYDWCKCIPPGCFATSWRVQFGCSRCGKINREYAKKAVVLAKEFKAQGKDFTWSGPNAEADARKAAGAK
jgi:hypothetical protein